MFQKTLKNNKEVSNLKRTYDFETLASKYLFNVKEIEKVCRISDLLEDFSAVKILSDHLALYGGTAHLHLLARNPSVIYRS